MGNSQATILGDKFQGNSITDKYCDAQKDLFGDPPDFEKKGSLKTMGEALDRGMVLVMSLWDDILAHMLWLDSAMGKGGTDKPGVLRGPCSTDTGVPTEVRQKYGSATVSYTNIMYGEINSTFTAGDSSKPAYASKHDQAFIKRLAKFSAPPAPPGQPQQQQQPAAQPSPAPYRGSTKTSTVAASCVP